MTEPLAVGDYPGIHIEYYESPYRHYLLNDDEAVSVTSAIGIVNKPALMYYAERETADGIRALMRIDGYRLPQRDMRKPRNARAYVLPPSVTDSSTDGTWLYRWRDTEDAAEETPTRLIRLGKDNDTLTATRLALGHLKQMGVDHKSKTNEASSRGVDVHQVWEDWNTKRAIPDATKYPENRRGYIRALAKAITVLKPRAVETEAVVGSAVHGFAGRLDTVVVVDTEKGLSMVDIKTSRGVYENTHFPQLAGYELARRECGLTPTARQGILRLDASGEFNLDEDLRWSDAEPDDFLVLLSAWKSQQRWAKRRRK